MPLVGSTAVPLVSIVIPSYDNRGRPFRQCIDALYHQKTEIPYEIIVVHSFADDTGELLAREFPVVQCVFSSKGLPVGQARNIGAERARGEVVLFIDTDCMAPDSWLEQMYTIIEEHQADGICGAFVNGTPDSKAGSAAYYLEFFRFLPSQAKPRCSTFLLGGNSGFRKNVFLNAQYRTDVMVGSDYLFSTQLARQGKKLVFAPSVAVKHMNVTALSHVLRYQHKLGMGAAVYRSVVSSRTFALFLWVPWLAHIIPLMMLPRIWGTVLLQQGLPEAWRVLVLLPWLLLGNTYWAIGCFTKFRELKRSPE